MAQTIELIKRGYPLHETVYVDIKFNRDINGEHPIMAEWIPKAEDILKREFGITVKHLTAKHTFEEYFYKVKQRGTHIGERYGFPFTIGAWCNSRLKLNVISKYINSLKDTVTEYVGIAYDEPIRYARLQRKNSSKLTYLSPLYDLQITEKQAFEICRCYNLISPKYEYGGSRSGCWFCVKQSLTDLYKLYKDYPSYFKRLMEMEKESRCTFNRTATLEELSERFALQSYYDK